MSSATGLPQHRSSNSNYIPIDHPSSSAPTFQGNSDVAEARYQWLNTWPDFGADHPTSPSVTAAQGKRPRAVTKHKKETLERPLKRSRNGEDAGSRRSAGFKRGTRGAWGPYGPRPAKEQKAMERKALLEADPYACKVRVHWVRCFGCDNDISLDKRSEYYPGLWIKHRRKCKEIAKLREKEIESIKVRKHRVVCGFDLADVLSHFVGGTNSTTGIPVSATPRRWDSIWKRRRVIQKLDTNTFISEC